MPLTGPNTTSTGSHFEGVAERFLRGLGYQIVARNWRCATGELDLVAVQGDTLAFVEVRSRAAHAPYAPEETIGPVKRRRLVSAAEAYLAESDWAGPCRFDVVAIDIRDTGTTARLFVDAFRADPDLGGAP